MTTFIPRALSLSRMEANGSGSLEHNTEDVLNFQYFQWSVLNEGQLESRSIPVRRSKDIFKEHILGTPLDLFFFFYSWTELDYGQLGSYDNSEHTVRDMCAGLITELH